MIHGGPKHDSADIANEMNRRIRTEAFRPLMIVVPSRNRYEVKIMMNKIMIRSLGVVEPV